jgi:hypothetical protein
MSLQEEEYRGVESLHTNGVPSIQRYVFHHKKDHSVLSTNIQ